MAESLRDHVALVTGSSSGIGRATALELSAAGAAIVCGDLRPAPRPDGYESEINVETVELIQREGGRACFVEMDVRDSGAVQSAIEVAAREFGRLDILVNCAGVYGSQKSILEATEQDYDFEMGVNAKGTWLCCKYGIQQMLDQEPIHELVRGRIVNFASVAGLNGMPNSSMYSQAKASVIGLTRALAIEYGQSGITVNAIAPGLVQTGMSREGFDNPELAAHLIAATPTGRHGLPTDVSRAVLFLATDEAGFLTGHTLPVDGGMVAL